MASISAWFLVKLSFLAWSSAVNFLTSSSNSAIVFASVSLGSATKDTNKTIGILAIVFIVLSVYVTAINIFTTQVTSILSNFKIETSEIMIRDMLAKYKYCNVLSYASLLGIFITLFILQKGMYAKTFKVKVEPTLNEEAE